VQRASLPVGKSRGRDDGRDARSTLAKSALTMIPTKGANPMRNRLLPGLTVAVILFLVVAGCAHRREAYYPSDLGAGPGVHVRAPFVDVKVQGKRRGNNEPTLNRQDNDRDKQLSRRSDDDDENERD
jgi:hypothetical protein